MMRSDLFVTAAQLAKRLPHFRGRNRAVLSLLPALRLDGEHLVVDATLSEPVRYRARLDMHSWLQRLAFVNGGYEAETVRLLLRLLEASPGYLLDIGANVGLIAIPAARMSNRKVVAIEAVPDNAAALAHNISMNSLGDSIRVIPMGVGEVQAKVDIQVEGDLKDGQGTGSANILPNGSTYQCERIQIEVTTLDLLLSEKRIDATCGVVKIDTDGYDLKVLQGGTTFLERSRPIVFGEFAAPCLAWHGQTVDDVKQFAASHDYVAWAADGHGSSLFRPEADRATFVQDLLLVPSEKVSQLGWCLAPPSH